MADGVVQDELTCLEWEETAPEGTYSNAEAIAYCSELSLGGHDDWRLPTRVEWASVVDPARSPALDGVFTPRGGFHKTGSNWVLTIEQRGAGAGRDLAWAYNLSDGIVSNARSAAQGDSVRCVRGNGAGEGFDERIPCTNLRSFRRGRRRVSRGGGFRATATHAERAALQAAGP